MTVDSLLCLQVLTPDGLTFKADDLTAINIRLVNNESIGIKPGHAALIAETALGKVKFRSAEDANEVSLHPGILSIRDNTVTIFTAGIVDDKPTIEKSEINFSEYERLMNTIVDNLTP